MQKNCQQIATQMVTIVPKYQPGMLMQNWKLHTRIKYTVKAAPVDDCKV